MANSMKMELPAYRRASSFSPRPMARLKLAEPPIPHIRETAVQVMVRGNATLVAALPSMPTLLPIKNWSTMLYSALTSMAMMLGMAKRARRVLMGTEPRGLLFVFSVGADVILVTSSFVGDIGRKMEQHHAGIPIGIKDPLSESR